MRYAGRARRGWTQQFEVYVGRLVGNNDRGGNDPRPWEFINAESEHHPILNFRAHSA
jgi:hypothetical protein